MGNYDVDKVKGLFGEWYTLSEETKDLGKDITIALKKDVEYQKLLEQQKEIKKRLELRKDTIVMEVLDKKKSLLNEIKTIANDIKEILDVKINIVKDIFKYYKKKFEKGIDDLDIVVTNYVTLFDVEDNIEEPEIKVSYTPVVETDPDDDQVEESIEEDKIPEEEPEFVPYVPKKQGSFRL